MPGTNPTRDAAGNNAAALTAQAVTNSTPSVFLSCSRPGQQGAWYDPSDFAALYQDAAGTVRSLRSASQSARQFISPGVETTQRNRNVDGTGLSWRKCQASRCSQSIKRMTGWCHGPAWRDGRGRWCCNRGRRLTESTSLPGLWISAVLAERISPARSCKVSVLRNGAMTDSQIVRARAECIANGAGMHTRRFKPFSTGAAIILITSFPAINTSSWTNFHSRGIPAHLDDVPSYQHVVCNIVQRSLAELLISASFPAIDKRLEQIFSRGMAAFKSLFRSGKRV